MNDFINEMEKERVLCVHACKQCSDATFTIASGLMNEVVKS